ncbi:hypothetical protein LS482_13980 [Sinomicrobium kalidii]|uniref:sensor histidine kinase n=1 Tax=Sinomicrobium kalidii TaxID=2900738 RepID=UPI001E424B21|nr:ATP-binding protein [Sinomicrobium kalidii]UGU14801.1 hypothetical protein LS482_13980 [Sinomicrobium kalidii]
MSWIIGTLLLFVILVGFIIAITRSYVNRVRDEERQKAAMQLAHSNSLLKHSLDIQEKERTRIASDLHDELISRLYRVKLVSHDKSVDALLRESIDMARRISHDLSPPMLSESDLGDLLKTFLYPVYRKYHMDFFISREEGQYLSGEIKLNIYRIFQELITNIQKHSGATSIQVRLRISRQYVLLSVGDNGTGMPGDTSGGLGVKNIDLRARQLKAYYGFRDNRPAGTKFVLCYERKGNDQHNGG